MTWVSGVSLRDQCEDLRQKYTSNAKGAELLASILLKDFPEEVLSTDYAVL